LPHAFRVPRLALAGLRFIALGLVLAVGACAETPVGEEPRPYDEHADADAAIAAALAANPEHKRILLTFGANWCSDSRGLEMHFRDPGLAALLEREFRVVYIDVGMFHRNLEITKRYGDPIDKGIPSVVLLDAGGSALFVNHGALSSARDMSLEAVRAYFEHLAADNRVD